MYPNRQAGYALPSHRDARLGCSTMIRVDRVELRLQETKLNPFAAARKAGLDASYVRDILRGKIKEPGAAKLEALAKTLGCTPAYLMGTVDYPGPAWEMSVPANKITAVVDMPIRHEVAAGSWHAVDEVQDIPLGSAPTALVPEYATKEQWLERVRGPSMNKILPDGALVHVVSAIDIRYEPKTDDLVIAVRRRAQGAFIERSIKQVVATPEGEVQLWPRSHDPRFQTPLVLLEGAREGEDVEVEIAGKVIRAYITF